MQIKGCDFPRNLSGSELQAQGGIPSNLMAVHIPGALNGEMTLQTLKRLGLMRLVQWAFFLRVGPYTVVTTWQEISGNGAPRFGVKIWPVPSSATHGRTTNEKLRMLRNHCAAYYEVVVFRVEDSK